LEPATLSLPLQVYLDSNDFSRFGQVLEGAGKPEYRELYEELMVLADEGEVEFRLSYIHVAEGAATAEAHIDRAVHRAAAMATLTRGHCLAPYFTLHVLEAAALVVGDIAVPPRLRNQLHARNHAGRWFPSFRSTFHEIADAVAALARDPFQSLGLEPGNRKARRQQGKAPQQMRRVIEQTVDIALAKLRPKMRQQFPMTRETESAWRRMILDPNPSNANAAEEAMAKDLSDLRTTMPWLTQQSSGLSGIPTWLRRSGGDWVSMLRNMHTQREALSPALPTKEQWSQMMRDSQERMAKRLFDRLVEDLQTDSDVEELLQPYGVSRAQAVEAAKGSGIDGFPSCKAQVSLLAANMNKNVSP
jgi:hypothetical protein